MKTLTLILISLLFFSNSLAQNIKIFIGNKSNSGFKVYQQSYNGFILKLDISELIAQAKQTPAGKFYQLLSPDLIKTPGNGEPMLPVFSKLIQIPFGAQVKIKILKANYTTIKLKDYKIDLPIIPAQPPLRKDLSPVDHFVYKKDIYNKDNFISRKLASIELLGIMRGKRYGRLEISPIAYNPVRGELKIYYHIEIQLIFKNPDIGLTQKMQKFYSSPANLINSQTINKLTLLKSVGIPSNFPSTYVIVAPQEFSNDSKLQEFIAWKQRQGYKIITGFAGVDFASNQDSIRNWLKNLYYNPPAGYNPPAYLLLIGDIDNMPAHQYTEITDQPYSDLYYADYTNDYRPEIDFGRISADDTNQLNAALTKILYYERDQYANDFSFLHNVLLVPGNDESHEDTWGNGQIRYGVTYYFNADHNIYAHTFYQDPEDNGVPGGNDAVHDSILANVDTGISFANYTAHCSPNGWYSPSFSNSDLDALTNKNKYSIWIGNCCQSNKFDENDAFGEKALYIKDKGAAGYIGASQYTYWDEDYWWGVGLTSSITADPTYNESGRGAYDASFHDMVNEVDSPGTWALTLRQIIDAGNLAVDQSSSSLKNYYWCIYQVSGDPSMMTRIGTPQFLTLNLDPLITGTNKITGSTLPYAFVSASYNNQIIAVGMADANGNLNLTTNEPLPTGLISILGYGQNMTVFQDTVPSYAPDKPFLIVNSISPEKINYDSTTFLSIEITNLNDTAQADSVYLKASINDTNFVLIKDSLWIGKFNGGDTIVFDSAIALHIDALPDNYYTKIKFSIYGIYNDTSYTWTNQKLISVQAPKIEITQMQFADPQANGYIDLGTTDTLFVTITNIGNATLDSAITTLTTSNPEISLIKTKDTINIAPNSSVTIKFPIYAPSTAISGVKTWFNIQVEKQIYTATDSTIRWIGEPQELIIGEPNITVNYPLYNYYENEKTQILYTKNQLIGPHLIDSIGFFVKSGLSWTFKNFKIYINETDLDNFTESYAELVNATLVLDTNLQYPGKITNNFFEIALPKPFFYSGEKNLLMTIVWGDNGQYQNYNDIITTLGSNVEYNAVSYGYADDQTPPDHFSTTNQIPNTKFVFEPFGKVFLQVPHIYTDSVFHESNVPLPLTVKNYGSDTAFNQYVYLRSLDSQVIVLDSLAIIPKLAPGQVVNFSNIFTVHTGILQDGHKAHLQYVTNNATQNIYLTIKAPNIKIIGYKFENDSMFIHSNESNNLIIKILNTGHSLAPSTIFSFKSGNENLLTVGQDPGYYDIPAGDTIQISVPVSAADLDTSLPVNIYLEAKTANYIFKDSLQIWINEPRQQYIGNVTDTTLLYPFYQLYENEKSQFLFLKNEFIFSPVTITSFGVYVTDSPSTIQPLKNFKINIFETPEELVNSSYLKPGNNIVTVFDTASYSPKPGWNIFKFNKENYSYDGKNNLVIEIVWGDNGDWSLDKINVATTATGVNTVAYGYADDQTPPPYSDQSNLRPIAYFEYKTQSPEQKEDKQKIKVTANLADATFTVFNASGFELTVFDMSGKAVLKQNIISDKQTFSTKNLSMGVYTLIFRNEKSLFANKLILN